MHGVRQPDASVAPAGTRARTDRVAHRRLTNLRFRGRRAGSGRWRGRNSEEIRERLWLVWSRGREEGNRSPRNERKLDDVNGGENELRAKCSSAVFLIFSIYFYSFFSGKKKRKTTEEGFFFFLYSSMEKRGATKLRICL